MAKKTLLEDVFENKSLMIAGAAILVYYFVLKPAGKSILQTVGLQKTDEEIKNQAAATNENAWSPNFWKTGPAGTLLLHQADADNYADTIYHYFGVFNDDYESVLGVIKRCITKSQVSFIANAFFAKYNKDMYAWLVKPDGINPLDGLSSDHLTELNNYVSKLPNYVI